MGILFPTVVGVATAAIVLKLQLPVWPAEGVSFDEPDILRRRLARGAASLAVYAAAIALIAWRAPEATMPFAIACGLGIVTTLAYVTRVAMKARGVVAPLVGLASLAIVTVSLHAIPWREQSLPGAIVGGAGAFAAMGLATDAIWNGWSGETRSRQLWMSAIVAILLLIGAWWIWWGIGLVATIGLVVSAPILFLGIGMMSGGIADADRHAKERRRAK